MHPGEDSLPVHLQVAPPITLLAYRLLYAPSDRIIYHRRRRRSLYLIRTSRFGSQSVFPRFSVFLAAIRKATALVSHPVNRTSHVESFNAIPEQIRPATQVHRCILPHVSIHVILLCTGPFLPPI